MSLTKHFKETVVERANNDPAFKIALLEESVNEFLSGDLDVAKALLRDYVNASISFEELSKQTKISNKSLQRMLSVNGNPTTSNFCSVLQAIQKVEGVYIGAKIHN